MNTDKVDVAVQSYKKPESLIYTLLSLKKYSGNSINCIYIDDDKSGDDVINYYKNPEFIELMSPIKIKIRVNKKHIKPGRSVYTFSRELFTLLYYNPYDFLKNLFRNTITSTDDIRYQWAINNTECSKLFIIHDDIKFNSDVISKYLKFFDENDNLIIVGQLGQCNVCKHTEEGCNPSKIMNKIFPNNIFPKTVPLTFLKRKYERVCRINEWCCMLDVEKTRKISAHFGNYIDYGDVGAYWFEQIIKKGYDYLDPHPTETERLKYFEHCWQGHSGHSVWVDQGNGIQIYKKDMVKDKIYQDFGFKLPTIY